MAGDSPVAVEPPPTPTSQATVETLAGAQYRSIQFEGGGHWLHHDQFDAFMTAVRDFL
jgi:hypothetical protein